MQWKGNNYLAQHPYEIYYSTADKRYSTYLPPAGENTKRKLITSVDRTKLENKIIAFYKKLESAKVIVVPHSKTEKSNREIILTSNAKRFFKMIVQANADRGFESEYLMLDQYGERMRNNRINHALHRLNQKIGIEQKGNHGIRKPCKTAVSQTNKKSARRC